MNCGTCRWFNPTHTSPVSTDECRRNAPIFGGPYGQTNWPRVTKDDWCGEYEEKKDVTS